MNYINISVIKDYIQCEKTGDWEGHLRVVSKLLNLFAASGHINYAKSGRLYLQQMRELPDKHLWVYQKFINGHHAVCRSSKYWAGLWTDLCVEQVLMQSMKSQGGLTRGRGMTKSIRHQWVYSMCHCAAVHEAMSSLTNSHHLTSNQHAELGKSRSAQDAKDMMKMLEWFDQQDPFNVEVSSLQSLTSGLTATDEDMINCDQAKEVDEKIQTSLDGVAVKSAKIKRSENVRTLQNLQAGIRIDKKGIHSNPAVLFMCCTVLAQWQSEDVEPYFIPELAAIPTSLFKDDLMRRTDKSELARVIKKDLTNLNIETNFEPQDHMKVGDGGWLLHHMRWKKNTTSQEIAMNYESFLSKTYRLCFVVFDGYEGPSMKDHEHKRRCGTRSDDVTVTGPAMCHKNQEAFFDKQAQ